MKRSLLLLLAVAAIVPAMLANTVTTVGGNGYGPYQTGQGGEFTLQVDEGTAWILNQGYVGGVTKDLPGLPGTFQTFCVEETEYVYPSTTFNVTFTDHSINTGNTLTLGAAWLYHQFQIEQLAGYDWSRNNRAIVQQLQDAIWWFMGVGPNTGNQFIALANGQFANALLPNNGAIPVKVMNLWALDGGARQDMLVCAVPDGGMTLMMLGAALAGIGALRRKLT